MVEFNKSQLERYRKELKEYNDDLNQRIKKNKELSDKLKELGETPPPLHTRVRPVELPEPPANSEGGMPGGEGLNKPPEKEKWSLEEIMDLLEKMGFPPAVPTPNCPGGTPKSK